MDKANRPVNALTVDVEDYFQVSGFESGIPRDTWETYPQRAEKSTQRLLEIFASQNVQGTFYILGWVAEKYPNLIREIAEAGHEIGSHSHWHRLVYEMTPDEFRSDLRQSKSTLEDITGRKVCTYRAPTFSITQRSIWALRILVEEGFTSDSSIFPVHHDRYGMPNAPTGIHRIQTESGDLLEFPPTVVKRFGVNLPVSGGGYFRFYPLQWSIKWLSEVNALGDPFVFYLHPWEIDPDQPRLRAGNFSGRFRHYINLNQTESRLERLLQEFKFSSVEQVLAATSVPSGETVRY